jgi:hypothetical protein
VNWAIPFKIIIGTNLHTVITLSLLIRIGKRIINVILMKREESMKRKQNTNNGPFQGEEGHEQDDRW